MSRRVQMAACVVLVAVLPGCAVMKKLGLDKQVPGTIECERMSQREPPWEEERDIGGAVALGIAQKGGGFFVEPAVDGGVARPDSSMTDQLNLAVAEVGFTVANYSPRSEITWTFGVLESPSPNAFSTPGGYVLVTRGLLKQLDNESQLAGVLAHEIAHVSLRHALHVYRTTKVGVCVADKMAAASIGTVNVKSGGQRTGSLISGAELQKKLIEKIIDPTIDALVSKGFAQGDEFEADAMAVDLLAMAGYDPREYSAMLKKLPAEKGVYPNHPSPLERVKKVDARLSGTWKDFGFEHAPKVPLDARIVQAVQPPKPGS